MERERERERESEREKDRERERERETGASRFVLFGLGSKLARLKWAE
jgi:hypothetical protein